MTQQTQVDALIKQGVDFAGFIFYPKSPRYVLHHMSAAQLKSIVNIRKVGVFVNAPEEEVLQMVEACGLDIVQLHGDETPRYCEKIAETVAVIKAFRIAPGDSLEWKIKDYTEVVDMFLFDTEGAGYGGTGKKFDWTVLKDVRIEKPFLLSGGIAPDDIPALEQFLAAPASQSLMAVDINSKFERNPGDKNMQQVAAFHNALQMLTS